MKTHKYILSIGGTGTTTLSKEEFEKSLNEDVKITSWKLVGVIYDER